MAPVFTGRGTQQIEINLIICTVHIYIYTGSLQLVYCRPRKRSSSKIKPRYMRGVCVCIIWTDVKLLIGFSLICRGCQGCTLDWHQRRRQCVICDIDGDAHRRTRYFSYHFCNGTWLTQDHQAVIQTIDFTSGITVGHLRLFKLHQNLPQYFRRNHVADSILDFLDYFAETMSPMYLDYFIKTTSPIYNFWWRSWTWKSFRRTSIIRRMHR